MNYKPYVIWACAALFYIYQFVLRVSPGLIVDDLMVSFQVDASVVANLAALAMYSYALLQIPAGIMVDAYGARRVLFGSILFCLGGVTLFTVSPDLLLVKLGRVLLGAGSASAFVCVCKVSVQWFSIEKRARLIGLTMAAGTVGAFLGSRCLSVMISSMGWRTSLLMTHFFGLSTLVLAYFIVPHQPPGKKPEEKNRQTFKEIFYQLVEIARSKVFWGYAVTGLGLYVSVSTIADLWGVPFVMGTYNIDKPLAAQLVALIYVGLCFGSLFLTTVADLFGFKQELIKICTLILIPLVYFLFYQVTLPLWLLAFLFFLIGFFAGAEMLCFACLCETASSRITGTLTGFTNCVVMLGGAFITEQVGRLLDFFWAGEFQATGVRLYSTLEYQKALTLILAVMGLSLISALFLSRRRPLKIEVPSFL